MMPNMKMVSLLSSYKNQAPVYHQHQQEYQFDSEEDEVHADEEYQIIDDYGQEADI